MSAVAYPLVAFGVWALVAVLGSIASTFMVLVLSWTSETQKTLRPRGLKALPAVNALGKSSKDNKSNTAPPSIMDENAIPQTEKSPQPVAENVRTPEEADRKLPLANSMPTSIPTQTESTFLLPPRMRGDPRRLTVVLDLDETLVRSCEAEEVPVQLEFAASLGLLNRFVRMVSFLNERECF